MDRRKPVLKSCAKGHAFYKTSDCPVCPVCEKEKSNLAGGALPRLGSPARRALENKCIFDLRQLSEYTEREILSFHGIGPSSLPVLKAALISAGLDFSR